jgi:hypothetical protein
LDAFVEEAIAQCLEKRVEADQVFEHRQAAFHGAIHFGLALERRVFMVV